MTRSLVKYVKAQKGKHKAQQGKRKAQPGKLKAQQGKWQSKRGIIIIIIDSINSLCRCPCGSIRGIIKGTAGSVRRKKK